MSTTQFSGSRRQLYLHKTYYGLTLLCVLVGGVFVPVIGWLIGIGVLWTQSWPTRHKIFATLVLPGGLIPAELYVVTPASGHIPRTLAIAALFALIVAPVLTMIHLWLGMNWVRPVTVNPNRRQKEIPA